MNRETEGLDEELLLMVLVRNSWLVLTQYQPNEGAMTKAAAGHGYLRSAMLAPIFSSAVLPDLRTSPCIPSPAACVAANFSKREVS